MNMQFELGPLALGGVFVNGFPGSGNVIAAQLAAALASGATLDFSPDVRATFSRRFSQWDELLNGALPEKWGAEAYFQHACRGEVQFYVIWGDGEFMVLDSIPLNMHLNSYVHSTHECPSRLTYMFYSEGGRAVLPILRHPLDVLVSFASKGHASVRQDLATAAQKKGISIRDLQARSLIADEPFLTGLCRLMTTFLNGMLDGSAIAKPLRYENCLSDPMRFVAEIADRLSVVIDDDKIKELSALVGTKQFRPGHFNKPSLGKWRKFFGAREIDIVRHSGLFNIFERLGYQIPEQSDALESKLNDDGLGASRFDLVRIRRSCFLLLSGYFPYTDLRNAFPSCDVYARWVGRHLIYGTDADRINKFAQNIRNRLLPV